MPAASKTGQRPEARQENQGRTNHPGGGTTGLGHTVIPLLGMTSFEIRAVMDAVVLRCERCGAAATSNRPIDRDDRNADMP